MNNYLIMLSYLLYTCYEVAENKLSLTILDSAIDFDKAKIK